MQTIGEIEEKRMKNLFNRLDEDGDGKITINEFHNFIDASGLANRIDRSTAKVMFQSMDCNNDGKISFAEFEDAFRRMDESVRMLE